MCLAIPGKIIEITDKKAVIDVMGAKSEASIELLDSVEVGDYIIVHAGCAIAKVDEEEALKTIELFWELKEIKL